MIVGKGDIRIDQGVQNVQGVVVVVVVGSSGSGGDLILLRVVDVCVCVCVCVWRRQRHNILKQQRN